MSRNSDFTGEVKHLGRVPLCLKSTEERLLRTENLYRGRGVLAEVGQAPGMADEPCTDTLTEERGQARRNEVHFLGQVRHERLAVLREGYHTVCEGHDIQHVDFAEGRAHGASSSVKDVLRASRVVINEGSEVVKFLLVESLLGSDVLRDTGVLVVVGHNLDEFGEVVAIPFPDAHREQVDVLVELVEQGDSLDDHVVDTVHVKLQLRAREGVTETELRFRQVV